VNVSSIAGLVAVAGHGHYCAVKHALGAMSEAPAQEVLAFDIRVAVVEPGMVVTPIFAKARRFADPASPYAEHMQRLLGFYQRQIHAAAQPEERIVDIRAVWRRSPRRRTPGIAT
jgi:NAD(P)-dependent dehydrogenase (short-subunit alcohol dehydrogenase family)